MPKNWCFWTVGLEKTLENPLDSKEIKPVNPKGNQHWILIGRIDGHSNTLVIWCKQLTGWKRPWCWERLKEEEEENRVWDGWIALPIQWAWSWANSRKWSGTGRSGMLQSMGSQRIRHDLATEQQELLKSPTSKFSHSEIVSPYEFEKGRQNSVHRRPNPSIKKNNFKKYSFVHFHLS